MTHDQRYRDAHAPQMPTHRPLTPEEQAALPRKRLTLAEEMPKAIEKILRAERDEAINARVQALEALARWADECAAASRLTATTHEGLTLGPIHFRGRARAFDECAAKIRAAMRGET